MRSLPDTALCVSDISIVCWLRVSYGNLLGPSYWLGGLTAESMEGWPLGTPTSWWSGIYYTHTSYILSDLHHRVFA